MEGFDVAIASDADVTITGSNQDGRRYRVRLIPVGNREYDVITSYECGNSSGRRYALAKAGLQLAENPAAEIERCRHKSHNYDFDISIDGYGGVSSLAISPDGRCLATARGFRVDLHDVAEGRQLHELRAINRLRRSINRLQYSGDGKRLGARDSAGLVRVWNTETGELLEEYPAGGQLRRIVNRVAFRELNHVIRDARGGADRSPSS